MILQTHYTNDQPLRYYAHNNHGTITISNNPRRVGGSEWLVWRYDNDKGMNYIEIISYQDKWLTLEFIQNGICKIKRSDTYGNFPKLLILAVAIASKILNKNK